MRQARAGRRDDGRDDLRQSAPVQRRGRLHQVPAQRGARPRDLRGGGRRPRLRAGRVGGLPARLRHGRLGRRGRASRWRARPGRVTSMASRPSSRSCSTWSARSTRTSARRTPSRSWSSARWRATSRSRPRSSPARRSASRTAWRCRRATSTSRPEQRAAAPVLRRALLAAREPLGGGRAIGRGAARRRCGGRSRPNRWPSVDYVSVADGTTLAELERVDGPALLSLAVRFGTTRLIDNEPLGHRRSRHA